MNNTALDTAGFLLFNSGYIFRRLRKESERLGIRWLHITLLKDIEMLAPITQKELARANHVSEPSISVSISEMINCGWVSKMTNPTDRRSSTLSLTKKGHRALESDGMKLQKCLLPLLDQLDPAEVESLLSAESALAKVLVK